MSTTGTPDADAPLTSDIAIRLAEADLAWLVAAGTGDAVAAVGVLAGALDAEEVGYQASVIAMPEAADRETTADVTVALGRPVADADVTLGIDGTSAAAAALDVARDLDGEQDVDAHALALAGTLVDHDPLAEGSDRLGRRPGIGVPGDGPVSSGDEVEGSEDDLEGSEDELEGSEDELEGSEDNREGSEDDLEAPYTDLADGLAHSTLVHAPFSGSVDEAREIVADSTNGREVASAVALAVTGDDDASARAGTAVERLLRPHLGGPLGTAGASGDVLDVLSRAAPGEALALALDAADVEEILPIWREHAQRAHAAVRNGETSRYDGLFVVRCGSASADTRIPDATVARLVRDYRAPEPVTLVVADGRATMAAIHDANLDVGTAIDAAATAVDGEGSGTRTRGRATFDDRKAFETAVRDQL